MNTSRKMLIIGQLLRNFNFALTNPLKPFESICNGIHMQRYMWVRVTERFPNANTNTNVNTAPVSPA